MTDTKATVDDPQDAVVVERVSKRFQSNVALDDVSVRVSAGELFGFIGPDGAGKTTLFRILATLLLPDSGTARVLGADVVKDLWALRRQIGYMPGRFSLYPDLSVEENLRFFASVFGTTVEREYDQIAPIYAQLEPFRTRRAAALSGGMKQKLALCCALVHRPQILFLDEPTIGLDINAKLMIRDLLNHLSMEHGTTLFLTSHDTADIEQVCDRVIVLDQGRLIQDSSIKDLKKTYIKKKILTLLTSEEPKAMVLPGVKTLEMTAHHITYEVDISIIPIDRVIQEAFKITSVKDVTIEDPSMEEIIRELYSAANSL